MNIAAIQMVSNTDISTNLKQAEQLLKQAVSESARICVLPEYFAQMGKPEEMLSIAEPIGQGKLQDFLANQAAKHGIYLVGGSIPLRSTVPQKLLASCLVFNPQGLKIGHYNKIHLFDVSIPEKNEHYEESATFEKGHQITTIQTPFANIGIGICYDIRFPEQFREMTAIEILAIPAAFTQTTGQAHWEVLLRARAIENQVYVIAANQGGKHNNGQETYGNSLIINGWGTVLNRREKGQGIVISNYDPVALQQLRKNFPVLTHR
ncbi:MAG: hypothetical protein RIT27_818 [Pseudomonadota bacterium]|jgi:nitrilase